MQFRGSLFSELIVTLMFKELKKLENSKEQKLKD